MKKSKAIHELSSDKYAGKDKCIYHEGDQIALLMKKDFDFFSALIKYGEVETDADCVSDNVNRDMFGRGWKTMVIKASDFHPKKMPWM